MPNGYKTLRALARRSPITSKMMVDASVIPVRSRRDLAAIDAVFDALGSHANDLESRHWQMLRIAHEIAKDPTFVPEDTARVISFLTFAVEQSPHLDARARKLLERCGADLSVSFLLTLVDLAHTELSECNGNKRASRLRTIMMVASFTESSAHLFIFFKLMPTSLFHEKITTSIRACLHKIIDHCGTLTITRSAQCAIVAHLIEYISSMDALPDFPDVIIHFEAMRDTIPTSTVIQNLLQILSGSETTSARLVVRYLPDAHCLRLWTPDFAIEDALFAFAERNGSWDAYVKIIDHCAFTGHAGFVSFQSGVVDELKTRGHIRSYLRHMRMELEDNLRQVTTLEDLQLVSSIPVLNASLMREIADRVMAHYPNRQECPLTLSPVINMVGDAHGHVFERDHINAWILRNGTNPLTREPLHVRDLRYMD